MACPLYKRLKTNGTSFYAFPGAAEDISSAYQNQNYRMYFSKYILLNFPKQNLVAGTNSNPIYFDFENAFQRSAFSTPATSYQDQLVESLRNYVANHESTIKESKINDTEYYYDNTELFTPTEKIFWKWCRKLNLVDFEPANNGDEYFGNLAEFQRNSNTDDEYFAEILWKEREVTPWELAYFNQTSVAGFGNRLQIEFEGATNFRIGDTIELENLGNGTLEAEFALYGYRLTVEYVIPATNTTGQMIVVSGNYNSGTNDWVLGSQSETTGTAKLIYHKFVQYIGEVNGINNVNQSNKSYTEVYAHVPDHTGQTPDILFRTRVDQNYKPNLNFPVLPSQFQPEIVGAANSGILNFTSPIVANPANYPGNFYGQFDTLDFTYESASGDEIRRNGEYFGISGNINNFSVNGSTIDGVCVDFDRDHYVKMNIANREITNFDQFNALQIIDYPEDFEFNAILWYYTLEDLDGNMASNLYGISFVDNPDNNPIPDEVGLRIPTFKKLATTDIQDGTSYAFSLNLSFNIVNDNPQDTYNPESINSIFSFNLFNEAMSRLSSTNDSFLNILNSQNALEEEVSNMKQLLYSQSDFSVINSRINNLELLLRLYSTSQFVDSDSIEVEFDTSVQPPSIRMNSIEANYHTIFEVLTSALYNTSGVIPFYVEVPKHKSYLLYVRNDDVLNFTLPDDDKLTIIINQDLYPRQSLDIIIDSTLVATQNKKLDIFINYKIETIFTGGVPSTNPPVQTKLMTLELPIYYNSVTQLSNSAYNWSRMDFNIDIDAIIQLNTGGILELPLMENSNIINNSFKVGDTILLNNFTIGTVSQYDFSGQYTIDSIGLTNSYIYLDVNNNKSLINYGASASNINAGALPLQFNSTSNYLMANKPYLDLNKGYKIRITRTSASDTTSIENRYLIEKIKF